MKDNKQKIRAIIFDLDNTLIDFLAMKEQACRAASQAMVQNGLKMSVAEAYDRLIQTYFEVGIESDIAFTEFLKHYNQFDPKILAAALNSYLKTKMEYINPYPNTSAVLSQLNKQGLVLGIVTDAPKTKAYQRLLLMGLEDQFRFVIGFEDTQSKKQTGLPYQLAFNKLSNEVSGITVSEVIMVGDSMNRDLIPAKKFGFKTAFAKYGKTITEEGTADFELHDITDLICILQ